jgi:hypothetical protein
MKFISIVGSVEEGRNYEPPVRSATEAKIIAELLGTELAKRGYGIIVYAGDFIERDVVRGFVKTAKARKSIRVLFPSHQKGAEQFPEYASHKALFDPVVDESSDWEMSFYGSLARVDGIVIIGGARSTLITGVLALSYRIPMIALQSFGGSGEKIWKALAAGRGLATKAEANEMAQRGDTEVVGKWIDSLDSQAEARRKELHKTSGLRWTLVAGLLVLGWVLTLPFGYWLLQAPTGAESWQPQAYVFLLFLAPILAGASGATMRMLIPDTSSPTVKSTVFGMAAGAISGVLYVLSHLLANPKPHNFAILVIAVTFGFIAGLTFDAVFKRLESVDVLRTEVLKQAKP